jgi:hydroxyacylglutathione hydrolase
MKRMNRDGPVLLGGRPTPRALAPESLAGALRDGAQVIDTRATASFGKGYVPGTLNMPLGNSFTSYVGTYLDYDRDIVLIADGEPRAQDAALALASIGLDRVVGWLGLDAIEAWCATGGTLETITHLTVDALVDAIDAGGAEAPTVLDVRTHAEWESGHLPGVENIPTSVLPQRLAELDRDAPLVLQCRSGSRSAVAASVLKAQGFRHVANLTGGIRAWEAGGRKVER